MRVTSDHGPLLLDTTAVKCGPVPFRFENMWLQHPGLKQTLKAGWKEEQFQGWESYRIMKKLKGLKGKFKEWSKPDFGELEKQKKRGER